MKNNIKLETPENTVNTYFRTSHEADEMGVRACFSKQARILGEWSGELVQWTVCDLVQRIVSAKANSSSQASVFCKEIVSVQKTSRLAIVKARNVVGDLVFLDTLILSLENQSWVIAEKIFMIERECVLDWYR